MGTETAPKPLPAGAHRDAAAAFADRALSRHTNEIAELYVFGSTVRGEAAGRSSDVDVLVVLSRGAGDTVAESLRDLAYDVMLEYGPVVELHILDESTFDAYRREGHPFVRRVLTEGQSYA
ncbi:nucleotidyltransferase domain-containing protein [Halomarina oriensis]|uniref:Nucleotidyltransferase domain-containing protein n=1 Tax=Halomarina oriensis TaxID=671145 RepID=A0A6B0GJ06_9EURY|nr:nucleotidyltransferase domain-containing protein [Halomarina oriensis]MWG33791.1 nucleotidyltransferase domain-containing protein [Halomarina oriensis]